MYSKEKHMMAIMENDKAEEEKLPKGLDEIAHTIGFITMAQHIAS